MNSFNDFGLAEPILRALAEEQYTTPTPIQAQTIPLLLASRDVVGIAQTGTGKTAAFALPILNHLAANRARPEQKTCRVLVLSPTRELSGQILDSFRTYGRHLRIQSALVIGGVPMGAQVRALMNGLDVLVATPGRLLDLMQSNALRLNQVEVLVLDEADRMLDMGFIHDIRKIVAKLPEGAPDAAVLRHHAARYRRSRRADAAGSGKVVGDAGRHHGRAHRAARHPRRQRQQAELLFDVLQRGEGRPRPGVHPHQARRRQGGERPASSRHRRRSDPRQQVAEPARARAQGASAPASIKTLVATDIAARGIDVDGISHVINFDLPNIPESYVHRIGRTARAGADGIAISFCDHEELPFLRDIEKLIQMTLPATGQRLAPRPGSTAAQHHRPQRPGRNGTRATARPATAAATNAAVSATASSAATARDDQQAQQPDAKPASGRRTAAQSGAPPDRLDPAGQRRFATVSFMQPR